jgi:hypothetical protein
VRLHRAHAYVSFRVRPKDFLAPMPVGAFPFLIRPRLSSGGTDSYARGHFLETHLHLN